MNFRNSVHDETWLLLPWLANGRLSSAQRARVEEHLRECAACSAEAQVQRHLCGVFTEPERVTHAPAPSFRKLMERIDAEAAAPARIEPLAPRIRAPRAVFASAWRPPGFAWAATFLLTVGIGTLVATTYRWSQPLYTTYTSVPASADVLHLAFDRSLPVGEVEELLRSAGARVVEGPGGTGVFGIAPVVSAAHRPGEVSPQMRDLAARLRADARVRWIEPLVPDPAQDPRPPAH